MNLKKQLVKRKIAGEVILVPVGDASLELKGLMTLNESGEFIFDRLRTAANEDELTDALLEEYDVSREEAAADVHSFIKSLTELGIL